MEEQKKSYSIRSTSRQSAVLEEDIVLSEGSVTRKVVRVTLVENARDPEAGLKIILIHQRKSSKKEWEDAKAIRLNTLRAGEGVRLDLDTAETMKLLEKLREVQAIREQAGLPMGEQSFTVIEGDPKLSAKIQEILSSPEDAAQLLEVAKTLQPDLVSKMSYIKLAEERRLVLKEFEEALEENRGEEYWQDFFEKHTWIFGYGLNYKILRTLQSQPSYGGTTVAGRGEQKGDYLTHTEAAVKFTVLVEIKTPQTELLGNKEYRKGAWELGKELADGVSQIQANCHEWEVEGSRRDADREALDADSIYTIRPKGILIIGNTAQLSVRNKRNTFERFRRSLHDPEIITFDELFARASFIVKNTVPDKEEIG